MPTYGLLLLMSMDHSPQNNTVDAYGDGRALTGPFVSKGTNPAVECGGV